MLGLPLLRCSVVLFLLSGISPLRAQSTAQAIGGEPFGVCIVRSNAGKAGSSGYGSMADFEDSLLASATDPARRALYPVAMGPGARAFLFKGEQPLELAGGLHVPVILDETAHRELLQVWWQAYTHQAQ